MEITHSETRERPFGQTQGAELSVPGAGATAGLAEVLGEAAWTRLRAQFGLTGRIAVSRGRGRTRFSWRLGRDCGYVTPPRVFHALVADTYPFEELAAARDAVLERQPQLARTIPGGDENLAEAVERLQEAIASGPAASYAAGADGAGAVEGTLWAEGDAAAGCGPALLAQAGARLARLSREVGQERSRQVCAAQDRAMAAALSAEGLEAVGTRAGFRSLARRAERASSNWLERHGELDGMTHGQRRLAADLLESRVPGFLLMAIGCPPMPGGGTPGRQP